MTVLFRLEDEDLGYRGGIVLRGISVSIAKGERIALVGESGAGKSTLLSFLQSRYKATTAYIPQDPSLVATLSVFHNVYMGSLQRHSAAYNLLNLVWPREREVQRVRSICERLDIDAKLFEKAGELSGGQQQRVAICRALLRGGDALFGDEPVSANDDYRSNVVMECLVDAFDTFVLAMHDIDLALAHSTRIIGIREQAIMLDEPASGMTRADLDFLYVK